MNIIDIFSAYEEYDNQQKDGFDRILCKSVNNKDYYLNPLVSNELNKRGLSINFPKNQEFAVALSHDIDLLYYNKNKINAFKNSIKSILKNDYKLFNNSVKSIFKPKRWHLYSLQKMIEIEKKFGANATYFFMAVDKNNPAFNYNINDQTDLLKLIRKNKSEVALHGSYNAYNDYELMLSEKNRLENSAEIKVIGYRNHNLNFKIENTFSILDKCKFEYDSTFGYADHIGFRNGMCSPFVPYDLNSKSFYEVIEFPLHVMDVSLFKYMNLNFESAFDFFKKIVDKVKASKGVLTFLWHNNMSSNDQLIFYEKCLNYLFENNAWITSHEKIYQNLRDQSYFSNQKNLLKSIINENRISL